MAVLSKSESDLIYKSWALAANDKEKHGGAFMIRLVLLGCSFFPHELGSKHLVRYAQAFYSYIQKNGTYLTQHYGNTGCGVFKRGVQN